MEQKLEQGAWIAPLVKAELDKIKQRVLTKDRDWVAIVDGEEGSGKSTLAMQICKYLDPEFDLSKVVFTSDEFLKLIKDPKTKKGTAILLDEAFAAANARASLTEVNRAMAGVATEMRQKNLFVVFCIPSFFDLDRYFALWRCRTLFHVYFTNEEDRSYVIFPKDYKKLLYLTGKKTYSYTKPHSPYPSFTFPSNYIVDEASYRQKKADAFKKRTVSNQARKWMEQRNALIKYILSSYGLTGEEIGKIPAQYGVEPISHQQISNIMKELGDFE